jgi:hypothetical protein
LAAENLSERFHFITALFVVMKSWRGDQPKNFEASEENVRNFSGQTALLSFENLVAKYYCQQFSNYFGRAAQIPIASLRRRIISSSVFLVGAIFSESIHFFRERNLSNYFLLQEIGWQFSKSCTSSHFYNSDWFE